MRARLDWNWSHFKQKSFAFSSILEQQKVHWKYREINSNNKVWYEGKGRASEQL